jgi:hypothetical protein
MDKIESVDVDIFENWKDDEYYEDIEALKYRIRDYEDYSSASNILQPKFRTLYNPEVDPEYSNESAALDGLLKKNPSELIAPEKKRIVVLLRAQGFTITEICQRVEWSKPTVIKTIRKFSSEISQLKRTELEELMQFYCLTLKKRTQTYGTILGMLITELQTRNLKDVPTDRLIDLVLKCQKAIGDDILTKISAQADQEGKLGKAGLY